MRMLRRRYSPGRVRIAVEARACGLVSQAFAARVGAFADPAVFRQGAAPVDRDRGCRNGPGYLRLRNRPGRWLGCQCGLYRVGQLGDAAAIAQDGRQAVQARAYDLVEPRPAFGLYESIDRRNGALAADKGYG